MKRLATALVLLAICSLAQPPASFSRIHLNQCREQCPGEACCASGGGWVCC